MLQKSMLFLVFALSSAMAFSQKGDTAGVVPPARVFESVQEVTIEGQRISLDAEAGTLLLRDENDEPIAHFGYTYYQRQGGSPSRPIIFAFNGGPLSASIWLHLGILGPKRVVVNDPGYTGPAPYALVNNEYATLDIADLVMIDPVGVGLSKPVGKAKWKDFWGVDQDIRSIGLFIEQFLIQEGRLNSPKYLLGESYGTFRNAGLMKYLQDKGIAMNGVIMVSAVFELNHLLFAPGYDMSYLVFLPTYAATAWYHGKTAFQDQPLEAFLDEARRFSEEIYAPALLKGDRLTAAERQSLGEKLSAYTGLSADFWQRANFRVEAGEFFQELLRGEGQTVGRLDSRFTGVSPDGIGQRADRDPQSDAISAPYITAFKHYLYEGLGVDPALTYTTGAYGREGLKWDWGHQGNYRWNAQAVISTAPDMADALSKNPNLKVLILNGYYDLATVFYSVEHTINHLGLPAHIRDNIIMKYYEAGHMMYTHKPSMQQFREDVSSFILETSGRK